MELEDGQGHVTATTGELCRKCRARHALMATDLVEAERGLCYVCAAEAELDARAPVAKKHGKVSAADCDGLRRIATDCDGLRRIATDCDGLRRIATDCV
jgi:hypothetical protein